MPDQASSTDLKIDEELARSKSRLGLIGASLLTLRLMEQWRKCLSDDLDQQSLNILLAVVVIGAEKLLRDPMPDPALHDLSNPYPLAQLTMVNVSSIASATGIHPETVRRRVAKLQQEGLLMRDANDSLRLSPTVAQSKQLKAAVKLQLDALSRTANQLIRLGIIRTGSP